MVYDELGPVHFEHGLALIKQDPTIDAAGALRDKFERSQQRQAERSYQGRLSASGLIVVSSTVNDFLEPDDPDLPLLERSPPCLTSVAVDQDFIVQLDKRNALTLGTQLLTKSGLGISTLRIGFKRDFSRHSSFQLSSALNQGPYALRLLASRRISHRSNAFAGATLSPSTGLLSVNMQVSRELGHQMLGELTWQLTDLLNEGCLRLRLDHNFSASQDGADRETSHTGKRDFTSSELAHTDIMPSCKFKLAQKQVVEIAPTAAWSTTGSLLQAWMATAACRSAHVLRTSASLPSQLQWRIKKDLKRLLSRFEGPSYELTLLPSGTRYGGSVQWRHSQQSFSKISLQVRFSASDKAG